ncbi:leucyl aminopeptidase family protein [Paraferrimonas sedimenticola]|uniref:Probable cytosol aminopeptidase n=1 Tax=Paraferrimonas sedimenticola TaxID=375674 RepID=A0AA37RUJ1_9GAMM|nr:leucyl aminopeptidase family protein [Paraferrimonas sedimenticola]GLP95596.1 putative cytosol aminopeptidase 1 [Paraferrimonas sedimenticola]
MRNFKLWQPVLALFVSALATGVNATSVSFENKVQGKSFARVVFQYADGSGNAPANLGKDSQQQLTTAKSVYDFSGKLGSTAKLVAPAGDDTMQVVVMGLGDSEQLDQAKAVSIGGKLAQLFAHKEIRNVDIVLKGLESKLPSQELAANIAHGVSLGSYRFNEYLPQATAPNNAYRLVLDEKKQASSLYSQLRAVESGVFLARDLVNLNGGDLTPVEFAQTAQDELSDLNVEVQVFSDEQIKAMKMGLLHAVGQGSVSGSRLVIAHYKGSNDKPIALVGKGVTFDTGGYNLKTNASIAAMKTDMAGAAAVLGTIKALAAQNAKVNVIGVMPLAHNMVSETALIPGDVLTSMAGKTVEIINTDAEGRLVMADAMWHVQQEYQPEILINIATLTGSKIRAVGNRYAGLFSDDMELVNQLTDSGSRVNEELWRLPLAYGDMLDSSIADTTNLGSGGPGASTAAMFLKLFVKEDTRWAHIDIAGNARVRKTKDETPVGANGFGVRLFVEWLNAN